ncbi:hypothetical protein [Halomonas sp. KO116]|uniref:hypothetical protein n=1 Tax=Halomonas sp. KO116 TaxID=1504981 RepID=UPI0004E38E35|nr:hypothetical protein [Halomonas sp. KO116]AJY53181.1 hypothetical protein KO116_P200074 [Halomonas sp. KO116]
MTFFILLNGKMVEVSGQSFMADIAGEHRLFATYDLNGRKWLADVATGITLTSMTPNVHARFSMRRASGKGFARRLLTKVLHEKGERQTLALLSDQPVINPDH